MAGLGLVEAKRRLAGGVGIHCMGGHVVAVDAGVVTGHAGGQRLNKGPLVRKGGRQVEGSDGWLAAHRLRDEVGQHARVQVVEDGLGDAQPANGGCGSPSQGGGGGGDSVVEQLKVVKRAPTCAGGVYDSLDPTSGEATAGHGYTRGTFHAKGGS